MAAVFTAAQLVCRLIGLTACARVWPLLLCRAGWGNNEAQCYTSSATNARVVPAAGSASDGVLQISATYLPAGFSCDNSRGPAGSSVPPSTRYWASAKLTTAGKVAAGWTVVSGMAQVAELEVRLRVPVGEL